MYLGGTVRVPPRRPPILPSTLGPTMNQQKRSPLLFIILAIPLRLQNPTLNLPLRTLKVEFLPSIKVFTLQLHLSEPRKLAYPERPSAEVLGIVVPGIVR